MTSKAAQIRARLRSGWTVTAVIALVVLAAWLPDLGLPLGDSDEGRILARFGMQSRNFWELGPSESNIGASVSPYIRSEFAVEPGQEPPEQAVTYAHHPPLQIFASIVTVGVLGDNPVALRVYGFTVGAATVLFMAALLRVRGIRWGPTWLAVGAMSCTGFFFVYGRMGAGFSLIAAGVAMVAYLREAQNPSRLLMAAGAITAGLAALQSWIGMAAAGLLVIWLFARRRTAPVTWWVAAGAATGVLITAAWILAATPVSELEQVVAGRTDTASFTFWEFLARQWEFAGRFTPIWFRVLAPLALVAGIFDRRTRVPVLITLSVAAAWTFGLQQGAWVHLLWNLPWVAPITIGLASGLDMISGFIKTRVAMAGSLLVGVVLVVTMWGLVTGSVRQAQLTEPAQAGEVLAKVEVIPPSGLVWIAGISTARWASYYLEAPVWRLNADRLGQVEEKDLVLVRSDRVPDYIPQTALENALYVSGRYRLLSGQGLGG